MNVRDHHARLERVRCRLHHFGARVSGGAHGFTVVVAKAMPYRASSLVTLEALADRLEAGRQGAQK